MKNNEIYCLWEDFINDKQYKRFFESNETKWKNNLLILKTHLNKIIDNNENFNLQEHKNWIGTQKKNFTPLHI